MDLNRLRYFCVIAQTGSMRKASELLRLSPAALSKATRQLEEELGLRLTTRAGRGIELTDQGRRLATRGTDLLRQADLLRSEVEQSATAMRPELRIATFEVFSTYFLKALRHLQWDSMPLILHDLIPGELEKALIQRQADLGITYMPVPTPGLDHLRVTAIEMGVYTSAQAFPRMSQPDLPFVVPVSPINGTPTRVRGLDGWPDDAYPRKVMYQVTLMESALELCRQGRAAGYFPVFVVQSHNAQVREEFRLVRRPSIYPGRVCTTDVFIVKRKSDSEGKTHKQLARAIRLVCKTD